MKKRFMSIALAAVLTLSSPLTALASMQTEQAVTSEYQPIEDETEEITDENEKLTKEDTKEAEEFGNKKYETSETALAQARASELVSGDFAYVVSGNEATITRYTGSASALTIPAQLDGIPVVSVSSETFMNNKSLTSVVISDGIKEIGHGAFNGCTALSGITFPKTLEFLGRWVFDGCDALESITIDQDSELKIDAFAFGGADHLTSITINGEKTCLSSSAFSSCNSVETVTLGTKVYMEGGENDASLSECSNLKVLAVSASNPELTIRNNVLYNEEMTKLLCYPAAMEGTEFTIPDSVTEIPSFTFQYNKNLQKLICGKGLKKIGKYVATDNYCLSIVEIPSTVTEIGSNSFEEATIWGKKDSTAHEYAKKYNLGFVDVDSLDGLDGKESTPGSDCSEWNGSAVETIAPVGNTYVVTNAAQLAWLAQQTKEGNSFAGKKILLDADIDLAGKEWTPIGNSNTYFQGSFDGQNHYIHNLKVTGSDSQSLNGLFGGIGAPTAGINTVIKNIQLENVEISGGTYGGGLAGYARIYKGTNLIIENIKVNGTVKGNIVGGLIGRIAGGLASSSVTVQSIENMCDITATSTGGGVIGLIEQYGYNYSVLGEGVGRVSIVDCSNDGRIYATQNYAVVAGVIGSVEYTQRGILTIEHCMSDGEIDCTSTVSVGGIVSGFSGEQNTIKQCVNYSRISGGYYVGGIVGLLEGDALVEQCYNEGDISVKTIGCYLAGIAGKNSGLIRDCYNTGSMAMGDFVYNGGIIGYNGGTIENCYNIGNLPNRSTGMQNISLPGEMGPLLGGKTSYCFFDKTQDEEGYLYGRMDTQEILTDEEMGIKYSGGMTTAEMKTPAAYIVWDFENVWEIDREYGYGYPILKEVKDILKKHPDESETSMEQTPDEYRITVVDQEGEVVPEAIVRCAGATMETNEDGVAIFLYKEGAVSISVTKDGYVSYIDDNYRMNPTLENTIRLISEDVKDQYALNSAVLWWHGNRYELLTQAKEINRKYQDEVVNIFCETIADIQDVEKAELYQGDELIAESLDAYFSLTADEFVKTKKNQKVRQTYVKVYLKDGTEMQENLNLTVVDEDSKVSQVEFGDNIKFVAGDDVPLIGGTEITFDTMQLPINFVVSEEKWKVSLNIMEKEIGEAAEFFKSELTATKKLEKLKKYMETGKIAPAKNPEVKLEIVGYGEGDLPVDTNKVTMTAYVKLSLETSNEVQVFTGVVFAVEFKGHVQVDGSIIWDPVELTMDGNLKLSAKASLSAFLGVGIANVASAGAYGTGSLDIVFYLLPKSKTGLEEMYLSADMKAVVRFMGSNAIEAPLAGPWYGWIYSRELEEYSVNSLTDTPKAAAMAGFLSELNAAAAESTAQAASTFNGSGEVLVEHAYSESAPVLMESQGDVILLYTDNGIDDRGAEDASVLMYSVYDKNSAAWGTPAPVWEDGTADFRPAAAGDYVVWNNAKGSLRECETYADLGKMQEIAAAKYNSKTKVFEETKNITDNDVFENNVNIADTQDGPYLAWTVNHAGNVFGVEGSNDIYMASSKDWKAEKVTTVDGIVLQAAPGVKNGKASCVYLTDENGSLVDSAGQRAYLADMNTKEVTNLSDADVSYAWMTKKTGQVMLVGADGTVFSSEAVGDDDSEPGLNMDPIEGIVDVKGNEDASGILVGNITEVLEDKQGNITLFSVVNEDNRANAYRISYDAVTGKWSKAVPVTEQTDYVEKISAVYNEDMLMYAYNQRSFDMESEDLNGVNTIRWNVMDKGKAVFSELSVHFNAWDVATGAELPLLVSVKNTGIAAAHGIKIRIKEGDTVHMEQVLDETILSGEEKDMEVIFTLPNDAVKREYTMEVSPAEYTEDVVSSAFTVGESYYKIEKNLYCIGGKYKVVATIQNLGFEKGSGTLELFDNTDTGRVYETFAFEGLAHGNVLYYSSYIENLDWDSFESKAIGICVMKDGKEAGDMRSVSVYQELDYLEVSSVAVSQTYAALAGVGYEVQLRAKILPEACADTAIVWTSSDTSVAVVNSNGLVTAVGEGQAYIMAATKDGSHFGRCAVEVGASVNPDNPNPDKPTPTPTPDENGNPFTDVIKGQYYYNPVLWAVENKITSGLNATTFGVGNACTREQIVTFLWNYAGKPTATVNTCAFTDANPSHYYYNAMLWAVENKITSGLNATTFGVGQACTREQIVTFLWNFAGKPAARQTSCSFTDVNASHYYYNAMLWAVENKVVAGYSNTTFGTGDACTREQIVTFLYRYNNL